MNAPVTHSESICEESISAEGSYRLARVSDAELLANTRHLVGRSNQLFASLLAHLAEVEARGIHRLRACPSLYAYCVYELRLSEDAAFRRARAARVARRFPVIFRQVADGELHLTALVLLAPHLTEQNHRELLALAKHRTKRELLRLVRALAPEPSVPDRVEPLGPEPIGIPMPGVPTWRKLVESLASGVRELPLGDRPKDWLDGVDEGSALPKQDGGEPPRTESADMSDLGEAGLAGERYKVQFTASQEYVDLLERAQDYSRMPFRIARSKRCTCERSACWSRSSRSASTAHLARNRRRPRRLQSPQLLSHRRQSTRRQSPPQGVHPLKWSLEHGKARSVHS